MGCRNDIGSDNNQRTLLIRNSKGSYPALSQSAALMDIVDGNKTIYNLYGEHNKPSPADIGAATKKEVEELKTSVSEGKALIAAAVTDKGVQTAVDATFATMANNINVINDKSTFINNILTNSSNWIVSQRSHSYMGAYISLEKNTTYFIIGIYSNFYSQQEASGGYVLMKVTTGSSHQSVAGTVISSNYSDSAWFEPNGLGYNSNKGYYIDSADSNEFFNHYILALKL
jgi:hypothetical protein